jgi:DNA polymerase-3 subunit alpha
LRYGILPPADILKWFCSLTAEPEQAVAEGLSALIPGAWKKRAPLLMPSGHSEQAPMLALTDINAVSGIPDFFREAANRGIPVAGGADVRNGAKQLYVVLVANEAGFEELNRWLSRHLMFQKPFPPMAPDFAHCLVIYPFAQASEPQFTHRLRDFEYVGVKPEDLSRLYGSPWRRQAHKLTALCTATFRNGTDFNTHRLLRCIDKNCLLSRISPGDTGSSEDTYRSMETLLEQYRDYPELLQRSADLLARCHFSPQFGKNQNKSSFTGNAEDDSRLLHSLAREGFGLRYPPRDVKALERLEKELKVIESLGFTAYFLISWDIVRYAHSRGFFYVGRGSGANSVVAYCLRITDVDPVELDLYFERFINPYRTSPPDFDLDFSWRDRDEVTRYIFERHGEEYTALLAVYSTFQTNAVLRELGKVFGLPKEETDRMLERLPGQLKPLQRNEPAQDTHALMLRYARRIHEMPNYRSIHAGGILISSKPIFCYSATDLPPKGFPTVQFSMLEAEDLGLHKFDILSQRGLGHIRDAVNIIRENRGTEVDIHRIQAFKNDTRVNSLIRSGRTMGCFYVESPAMRQLLQKLQCSDYYTLVAASSVIRPGVASSGMMRAFILRHVDPRERMKAHPVLLDIMPDTYGVMVYQEDVIKVAHHFAGLGLDESDVLRRGMSGKYRSREEFKRVRERWFVSCRERGHSDELAAEVWQQVESFAGYSFAKGHSASYAVESYQSLFLKAYYPLEFYTAVINNYGGFYRTEFYVHAARMCGALVEAPCVNHSMAEARLQGTTLWLGLAMVQGLEQRFIAQILNDRSCNGPFSGLTDFTERIPCSLAQMKLLLRIGAFRFTGADRKALMWELHWLLSKSTAVTEPRLLFREPPKSWSLPTLITRPLEDAYEQLELLGFPLCDPFVLAAFPEGLQPSPVLLHAAHKGRRMHICGYLVAVKPTRTLKGQEMYFGTWIDCRGMFFDTVHFPPSIRRFPFRGRGVYQLRGRVSEDFGVASFEVDFMERIPYHPDPRG